MSVNTNRTDLDLELKKQISVIRNAVDTILKNAKYGNYHNFLPDVQRIDRAASKMSLHLHGGVPTFTKKYGKILVPYDGSKYSKKALSEAIDIAKEFGAELHVINVIDISTDVPSSVLQGTINKKIKKLSREILEPHKAKVNTLLQEKVKMCKREGVNIFCEVMMGKPADSILKFAKDHHIELIMIGSRGLTKLKKLMAIGSISRKVSEEAKCPVMIIR